MKTNQTERDAPSEPSPKRSDGLGRVLAWPYLPWLVAGVALGLAILFGILWQQAEGRDRRRAEIASTATQFLTALTNFDGRTIDRDAAEITGFAVGDFADQVQTFFNDRARQALRKAKARSVGHVQKVFVESVNGQTASVFGVVGETVTNTGIATPRQETLRIEMDMIETKDGWKVNRVNILQSPNQSPLGGP
ncbi:MAG TPA: hypothetical protein VF660_05520 [Actinomycetota bacterium]